MLFWSSLQQLINVNAINDISSSSFFLLYIISVGPQGSIVHVYGILSCWRDTAELKTTFSVYRTVAVEKVVFEPFNVHRSFAWSEHNNDKLSNFEC